MPLIMHGSRLEKGVCRGVQGYVSHIASKHEGAFKDQADNKAGIVFVKTVKGVHRSKRDQGI